MTNATTETEKARLVFAIAEAHSAADAAEDREQLGRASKIRAQARALENELRKLDAAEVES